MALFVQLSSHGKNLTVEIVSRHLHNFNSVTKKPKLPENVPASIHLMQADMKTLTPV